MCPQGSVETISCPSTNCRGLEYLLRIAIGLPLPRLCGSARQGDVPLQRRRAFAIGKEIAKEIDRIYAAVHGGVEPSATEATPVLTEIPAAAPARRIVRVGLGARPRPIPPPAPSPPKPSPEAQKPQSPSPEAGASRPALAKRSRLSITELMAKRAERLDAKRAGAERLARARRGPAVETPATTFPRKVLSELEKYQRYKRVLLARQARYAEALKSTTPELGGDEISPTPELGGDEISPTPELGGDEMSRVGEQQAAEFPEAVQEVIVGETALTEQSHFLGETSVYAMGAECEAQRGGDSAEDSDERVGFFGRLKKFMWSTINAVKAVICP